VELVARSFFELFIFSVFGCCYSRSKVLLYVLCERGILNHGIRTLCSIRRLGIVAKEWTCMECLGQHCLGCVGTGGFLFGS
jgi:hypothetical protein